MIEAGIRARRIGRARVDTGVEITRDVCEVLQRLAGGAQAACGQRHVTGTAEPRWGDQLVADRLRRVALGAQI